MRLALIVTAIGLAVAAVPALAAGIPHLDHAFVILMENQDYDQVIGSPDAPFINRYAKEANLADNYYAIGHPSLTDYLEIIGGSNFGVRNDNPPDWHDAHCKANIETGTPALADAGLTCPIAGKGMDAATPEYDDNVMSHVDNRPFSYPAAPTVGRSIADQLQAAGKTWKSYQEDLPPSGADGVNYSDGLLTEPGNNEFHEVPRLYAVKHDPFVYFASVQQHGLQNVVGFAQLYADLRDGQVPEFAFISPNQCHDQHGRGAAEVGTGCVDSASLVRQGDAALERLVTGIKSSRAWRQCGHCAIVVVWDENDGRPPHDNRVVAIVDTNYGVHGVTSHVRYSHFSLLKTLEAGFGLPYLNHAADRDVEPMADLFATGKR